MKVPKTISLPNRYQDKLTKIYSQPLAKNGSLHMVTSKISLIDKVQLTLNL